MKGTLRWLLRATASFTIVVAGCTSEPTTAASSQANLEGTWTLVEVAGRPLPQLPAEQVPTFSIKGMFIEGFDGCNRFQGRLDMPGSVSSTRRGCESTVVRLPLDFGDPQAQLAAGRVQQRRLLVPMRNTLQSFVAQRAD